MEETLEVGATFPAPPRFYTRYTARNLELFENLKADGPDTLVGAQDLPEWDLHELEPPRADWIVEEGGYQSFGDVFPIPSREPTLEEVGLVQLYDPNARDRRPALHSLLRTLLHSYHTMLTALLSGPQLDIASMEDGPVFKYTEWMMAAALNMMHSVNGLRGMQARVMLEGLMRARVEERRRKVAEVRQKCKSLRDDLARLRERATRLSNLRQEVSSSGVPASEDVVEQAAAPKTVATIEDVARWVSEV
ncbi:hypothetical protein CALVIDRAFT_595931 [Calocera viscosa TUFC12733]|uniref:Mediator of RNA polymerase II transcription subunit 7 n=1 Tax=Calocera viscosa (strain TUFC12733) TaxID=1330018 RepID=A0A167Q0N6_CALVF|nr:hypothetical protein CALVIDRAFT_595931 [Calocera viscosa TUFC12733]